MVDPGLPSLRLKGWLIDNAAPDQIVGRCGDLEAMITALGAGLGLVPPPTGIAANNPDLLRCFPPNPDEAVPVWLLASPEAWRQPEVRPFAGFLVPRFRALFKVAP